MIWAVVEKMNPYLKLNSSHFVIIQLPLFLTYFSAAFNADYFHIACYNFIARVLCGKHKSVT
jgi:hypothetical protein